MDKVQSVLDELREVEPQQGVVSLIRADHRGTGKGERGYLLDEMWLSKKLAGYPLVPPKATRWVRG